MRLEPTTLRGRHVVLEPLALEHAPALLAVADADRSSHALQPLPRDAEGMRAWVADALADHGRDQALPFVVRRPDGAIIGSTRFMSIEWWSWPGAPPPTVPTGPDVVEIGWTWYALAAQRSAQCSFARGDSPAGSEVRRDLARAPRRRRWHGARLGVLLDARRRVAEARARLQARLSLQ